MPTDDNARPYGQRVDGMTSALTIINFFKGGRKGEEGRKEERRCKAAMSTLEGTASKAEVLAGGRALTGTS